MSRTENFDFFIPLDYCLEGTEQDGGVYNDNDPYRHPPVSFTTDEAVIGDIGVQRDGSNFIIPFRLNQC